MKAYLDILQNILDNGEKSDDRTEVGTIRIPGAMFQHDMSKGFPLLTTKKMAFQSIRVELEAFIKGITDKKWLQDRGCHIWDEWANPQKVSRVLPDDIKNKKLYNEIAFSENDLGPIYGYQWNYFNADYEARCELQQGRTTEKYLESDNIDYQGVNQLQNIINELKTNPNSRRMVCSAWNPSQMHMMALPPCHFAWQVTVINNKLNLFFYIRSWDFFYGAPFNIASYALLLYLLCKETGYQEGILTGFGADVHLYNNTIDLAKTQLKRKPYSLPTIKTENFTSIYEWDYKNTKIENYVSHEALKGQIAV